MKNVEDKLVCIKNGTGLKVGKVYVSSSRPLSVMVFVGKKAYWNTDDTSFLDNHLDKWFVTEKQWLREKAFEKLGI